MDQAPKHHQIDLLQEFFDGTTEIMQLPEQITEHKRSLEEDMRQTLQDYVDHASITPEQMTERLRIYHNTLWRVITEK